MLARLAAALNKYRNATDCAWCDGPIIGERVRFDGFAFCSPEHAAEHQAADAI